MTDPSAQEAERIVESMDGVRELNRSHYVHVIATALRTREAALRKEITEIRYRAEELLVWCEVKRPDANHITQATRVKEKLMQAWSKRLLYDEEQKISALTTERDAAYQKGFEEIERLREEVKCLREAPNFWKDIVIKDNTLDVKQVKLELVDYYFILEQIPKIYDHITGGLLCKQNYHASTVIAAADDFFNRELEEATEELTAERDALQKDRDKFLEDAANRELENFSLEKQVDALLNERESVYIKILRIGNKVKTYMAGSPNIFVMLEDIESYFMSGSIGWCNKHLSDEGHMKWAHTQCPSCATDDAHRKRVENYEEIGKLQAQVEALRNALEDFGVHARDCILSQWQKGEPTADGGYRTMYAGKWYMNSPIDETPKCTCGFEDALRSTFNSGLTERRRAEREVLAAAGTVILGVRKHTLCQACISEIEHYDQALSRLEQEEQK